MNVIEKSPSPFVHWGGAFDLLNEIIQVFTENIEVRLYIGKRLFSSLPQSFVCLEMNG